MPERCGRTPGTATGVCLSIRTPGIQLHPGARPIAMPNPHAPVLSLDTELELAQLIARSNELNTEYLVVNQRIRG